jgi:hypothetical protein
MKVKYPALTVVCEFKKFKNKDLALIEDKNLTKMIENE